MHKEVITLSMDQQALENYVSGSHLSSGAVKPWTGKLTRTLVKSAINDCLSNINPSDPSNFRLRLATKADIETIGRMVQGLAEYVKEPDAVHLTVDNYRHDGFSDDDEPLYYCLLVDCVSDQGKVYTCGYAVCFFGCILGEGRFLYLEDLFLEVEYRQLGGGNLVMQTLAQICQSLQCTDLYWQTLDWNTSGLQFYDKIGAEILEGVMTSRYCGDAMKEFAEKGTGL
jgi:GNAT superfamily N-acetyltransferase